VVEGAKIEGKSFVNSGLQPGRHPQMIPIEVSIQMTTKRTVPCPAKTMSVEVYAQGLIDGNAGAEHTEEVPRCDVDRYIPHPAHSSDADDDAKTKHGYQGYALADRNLDRCEVLRWPKEDEN
jgi:hypothetical protein